MTFISRRFTGLYILLKNIRHFRGQYLCNIMLKWQSLFVVWNVSTHFIEDLIKQVLQNPFMLYLSVCMLDAKQIMNYIIAIKKEIFITNLVIHLWNVYGKCFIKTKFMFNISEINNNTTIFHVNWLKYLIKVFKCTANECYFISFLYHLICNYFLIFEFLFCCLTTDKILY